MNNDAQPPPGYRFWPTEEELLSFYLRNKLSGIREADIDRVIPVVNIYDLDPWHLPQLAGEPCIRDSEQWFFFCPRQPREAHGGRPTRTTPSGYWKATGSPGPVYAAANRTRVIGGKKTMVFYIGRAPTGTKTKWKMNEYRALDSSQPTPPGSAPKLRSEYSLCRVYKNSGCMRSFDRRPSMDSASTGQNTRAIEVTSNSDETLSGAKRARSTDSSSATDGEDGGGSFSNHQTAQGEGTDRQLVDEDEEIDWDQLEWL